MSTTQSDKIETAAERADFIWRTARYIANDTIAELHESHGAYWDFRIRDRVIPCMAELLERLKAQLDPSDDPGKARVAEIDRIMERLHLLKKSCPTLKSEVTEPFDLIMRLSLR